MINNLKVFYLQKIKELKVPRDLIFESIRRNKHKTCVIEENKSYDYEYFLKKGEKLAQGLYNLGLKKGDRLGILIYNSKEYFEIRIACYLTGIVVVPIVFDFDIKDIVFISNDCDIKCLIYDKDILKNNIKILKKETKIDNYLDVCEDYKHLIEKSEQIKKLPEINENDPASINFSSGTTGRPKGILLSQKSWMNSFYNYVLNSPKINKQNIRFLHILSLATAGGCSFLPLFFIGSENIFLKKYNTKEAINNILKHEVNSLFISPSYLYLIMDYCKRNKINLKLNNIVIGTEKISFEKFKQAIQFFGNIVQLGYGMAEILPPLTLICSKDYIKNGKLEEKYLYSVGKSVDGVKIKIIKDNRFEKIGRIAINSRSISLSYFNNQSLSDKYYKNNWFISEDFGYLDNEGYLHVLGREQDIINMSNKPIFRSSIEKIFYKDPKVLQCLVLMKEEKIYAIVALKQGQEMSEKELKDFFKVHDKCINLEKIMISKQLPINASGKMDIKKIRG